MKKWILPTAAAFLLVAAAVVLTAVPKKSTKEAAVPGETDSTVTEQQAVTEEAKEDTEEDIRDYAHLNEDGDIIIQSEDLSEDKAAFIRYSEDSKIELIAVKGGDGRVQVALGTCQSCNGSPNAYYVQTGEQLQCNNCGLSFPLSVIGSDGRGCHPIPIEESGMEVTDTGVVIHKEALARKEALFDRVAAH